MGRERLRANVAPAGGQSAPPQEEVARYIADMIVQLGSMASGAKLDLLAYFLKMAHAECVSHLQQPEDLASG